MEFSSLIDSIVEAPVVPSFTRIGYDVRSRTDHWRSLDTYDLTGRTILLTGATSGLGLSAAKTLAGIGATMILLGRDASKTERVTQELREHTKSAAVHSVVADMGDLRQIRSAAEAVERDHPSIDVLIHNAGALTASRINNSDGVEMTVASQVFGPFLLTSLLLPLLQRGIRPGRVLTMSSGGMYASPLRVSDLEMDASSYKGPEQYSRAKRAQVTLNELWASRTSASDVVFHALHPGWADTPGVASSLPRFAKIVGPLLRTPAQGADTLVWLAADDGKPRESTGKFWLDRRVREIHRLGSTKKSDTAVQRSELWQRCVDATGIDAQTT